MTFSVIDVGDGWKDKMEIPEVSFEELLVARRYLILCYRSGTPCTAQIYDGETIGSNRDYFTDSKDYEGNDLTYKFYLLPKMVR